MKTLLIAFTIITSVFAYQEQTASVKVWGNCEMCKARIEKALKMDGVKKADWNVETKKLTVSYDTGTVSLDQIQQAVAAAGHDTEKFRAAGSVYNKLPGCCQYERQKQKIITNK